MTRTTLTGGTPQGEPYAPVGATRPLADRLAAARQAAELVGRAPAFVRALNALPALASGDAAVLVSGETGTGKELVARAIHYMGPRAPYPFVPVNCGALPDSLLEDELFGHERGAFTDARARRVGLVEEADRGTVFLDEVDSLTPRAQVALLRLLQEKSFRPLGGGRERRVDVRFVAATNQPLAALVREGGFRADLYYRLAVLTVTLPPLRERREDIIPLAYHLLQKNLPAGRGEVRFSPGALAALASAGWPGNVRELENAVVRGIHLAQGGVIEAEDLGLLDDAQFLPPRGIPVPRLFPSPVDALPADVLPAAVRPSADLAPAPQPPLDRAEPAADGPRLSFQEMKQRAIDAFEREYLVRSMAEHGGNVSHAARAAGKERREFGKLLKKHHVDPRAFVRPR